MTDDKQQKVACEQCNEQMPADAEYCMHCGRGLQTGKDPTGEALDVLFALVFVVGGLAIAVVSGGSALFYWHGWLVAVGGVGLGLVAFRFGIGLLDVQQGSSGQQTEVDNVS